MEKAEPFGRMGFYANGWNPKPCRGIDYSRAKYELSAQYPPSVDLSTSMPPVYNQGGRGTCLANAMTALMEYHTFNREQLSRQFFHWALKKEDGGEEELQKFLVDPSSSPRFLMLFDMEKENCKNIKPEVPVKVMIDSARKALRESVKGASIETAYKVIRKYGICREELMPYSSYEMFNTESQPPTTDSEILDEIMKEPLEDAKTRIIESGLCLIQGRAIESYKRVLSGAKGKRPMPIVCGIMTFRSMHNRFATRHGWISCPFEDDECTGGHAMVVVGYKDVSDVPGGGYLIVRNSWGKKWAWDYTGHAGHARIPYAFIERYAHTQALTICVDDAKN